MGFHKNLIIVIIKIFKCLLLHAQDVSDDRQCHFTKKVLILFYDLWLILQIRCDFKLQYYIDWQIG